MNVCFRFIFYCIFLKIFLANTYAQSVIINELMSKNTHTIQDKDGDFSDWIELYNTTNSAIHLYNYSLSDDKNNLNKWIFPDVYIQPKGFLLIFASGKDIRNGDELHTNFSIAQSGEQLTLTDNWRNVSSSINPIFIPDDQSYACIADGSEKMAITSTPTPKASNNNFAGIHSSHSSGFYNDSFELYLTASNIQHQIYYTLNGETPSVKSNLYTGPITIKNNPETLTDISFIPTTPLHGEKQLFLFIWKKPKKVYKCNTIKYAAFDNGVMQGNVSTKSFFADSGIKKRYTFPIISIVTDSLNLFDYETGIYIPGETFDIRGFDYWPIGNHHNRGRGWERPMHLTYFDKNGSVVFETNAGMRIRGYSSASYPQKSFNVYFRKEYGLKKIEYPVFANSNANTFKRLIFRNSGNDFIHSHFKDAMLQTVIEPMNLQLQAFQPSIVFVNGEYWGIHNIREKYDKYYFKYKFDVHEDEVNILDYCGAIEEGDNSDYRDLEAFILSNDLSDIDNYNYVADRINIENFIDFQIAEIYLANYDWPCNNSKIWKDNEFDAKWQFLIYDLDASFGYDESSGYATNSIEHATNIDNRWPYCECSNLLFINLLKSAEFKNQFLDRFTYSLKNIFETDRVIHIINQFESMYSPEIEEHIERWNYPKSVKEWERQIEKLRVFATKRPYYITEHIESYFNIEKEGTLTLYPNPSQGDFSVLNDSGKNIEDGKAMIVDAQGRVIYSEENIFLKTKENIRFQLNSLSAGVYILIFNSKQLSDIKRFIVSSWIK